MVDVVEGEAILQTLPAAGLTYTFRVSTENIEGESLPSECPMIFLEIGKFDHVNELVLRLGVKECLHATAY